MKVKQSENAIHMITEYYPNTAQKELETSS